MRKLDMGRESWLFEARWLLVVLSALTMIFHMLSYDRGQALAFVMAALAYAALGIALYRGDLCKDRIYTVGLIFVGWYVVTRMLNGDPFVQLAYNQYRVSCLLLDYTLIFPLASILDDGRDRRALDNILLTIVTLLAAVVWIGVIAAFRGDAFFDLFDNRYGLGDNGRLYLLGQHPNVVAAFCLIGTFGSLYLLVAHWRAWLLIPSLIGFAGFFLGLALTDSRTGMAAYLLALVVACVVLFQRLRLPVARETPPPLSRKLPRSHMSGTGNRAGVCRLWHHTEACDPHQRGRAECVAAPDRERSDHLDRAHLAVCRCAAGVHQRPHRAAARL